MRTLPPKNEHCKYVLCKGQLCAILDAARDNWYLISSPVLYKGQCTYPTRYLPVAARDNLYDMLILLDAVLDAAQVTGI